MGGELIVYNIYIYIYIYYMHISWDMTGKITSTVEILFGRYRKHET